MTDNPHQSSFTRVCTTCGEPAELISGALHCLDDACGMVRILPVLPDRLPWETGQRPWEQDRE